MAMWIILMYANCINSNNETAWLNLVPMQQHHRHHLPWMDRFKRWHHDILIIIKKKDGTMNHGTMIYIDNYYQVVQPDIKLKQWNCLIKLGGWGRSLIKLWPIYNVYNTMFYYINCITLEGSRAWIPNICNVLYTTAFF